MFLLILTLIAGQKPVRDTMFVTVGGDTVWVTPDSVWSTNANFTISGIMASSYGNFTDSLATPKIKADIFSPKDSSDMEFTDDLIIDSTLYVAGQLDAGSAITDARATRTFNLVSTAAVARIWRFTG